MLLSGFWEIVLQMNRLVSYRSKVFSRAVSYLNMSKSVQIRTVLDHFRLHGLMHIGEVEYNQRSTKPV